MGAWDITIFELSLLPYLHILYYCVWIMSVEVSVHRLYFARSRSTLLS